MLTNKEIVQTKLITATDVGKIEKCINRWLSENEISPFDDPINIKIFKFIDHSSALIICPKSFFTSRG